MEPDRASAVQRDLGCPLTSHQVIVELIGATTTQTGLRVHAELNHGAYPLRVKVRDEELAAVPLVRQDPQAHGDAHGQQPLPGRPATSVMATRSSSGSGGSAWASSRSTRRTTGTFFTAVPFHRESWQTPDTYHTAGLRLGTATTTSTSPGTTSAPVITGFAVPRAMGREAVRLLGSMLGRNEVDDANCQQLLPCSFIAGDTSGPPPAPAAWRHTITTPTEPTTRGGEGRRRCRHTATR
jgi:Rhodopirellula transposase DDE domain